MAQTGHADLPAESVHRRTLELLAAHVDRLGRALEEQERVTNALADKVAASEHQIAGLRAEVRGWEQHWADLQGTVAWRVAMSLREVRRVCAPDGSARARFWRGLVRTVQG